MNGATKNPSPTPSHKNPNQEILLHLGRDLDLGPPAVMEGHTVPPADRVAVPAVVADVFGVELLVAELEPGRLHAGDGVLDGLSAVSLALGDFGLARCRRLEELLVRLLVRHIVHQILLELDELGHAQLLVNGQDVVAEGLGGVLAREFARLGHGHEQLLCRVAVHVHVVDGLVRRLVGTAEDGLRKHLHHGAGVGASKGLVL